MKPIKLTDDDAARLIRDRADIIPIDMNPETGCIVWLSMGGYHIYEGEFDSAIKTVRALQMRSGDTASNHYFETSVNVLDKLDLQEECLAPTGFVFGTSRCGSTLLARAMARDRQTVVLGEPLLPLHYLHWCHSQHGAASLSQPSTQDRFKKLILLMGRRRRKDYTRYLIKFSSLGIHFADVISAVFKDVPCLFLYRDPEAVLTSLNKRASGWDATLNSSWAPIFAGCSQAEFGDLQEYRCRVLCTIYSIALKSTFNHWAFFNYSNLCAENFNTLLLFFAHSISDEDRAAMERVFAVYSKSYYRNIPFDGDDTRQQSTSAFDIKSSAYQSVMSLYIETCHSPRNLLNNLSALAGGA